MGYLLGDDLLRDQEEDLHIGLVLPPFVSTAVQSKIRWHTDLTPSFTTSIQPLCLQSIYCI